MTTEESKKIITLKQVKAGAIVPKPIYKAKPYVIVSVDGVVLEAGDLDYIRSVGSYFDSFRVEVRKHDLHLTDNTKLTNKIKSVAAKPMWKVGEGHRIEYPTPGGGCVVVISEHSCGDYRHRNLIVQAVNEYDALCAVAEVAKDAIKQSHHQACQASRGRDIGDRCNCFIGKLRKSLATLATLREKGAE